MGSTQNWTLKSALLLILVGCCLGWGAEKVKLKDVQVLTLKHGAMTAGRRSSPVAQLKCVGGTAQCAFTPKAVQCYNRGSDGYDVQWECKADMDNAYRFGDISVTCEGYDYPDDPYVLKGSCGLEYTIDYTKEGQSGGHNDYYQQHDKSSDYGWNPNLYKAGKPKTDFITNICCGAVVVVIVYAIYKTCIAPGANTANQRSTTNDDYPRGGPGQSPPPPGFRSDYSSGGGGFGSGSGYSGDTGFGDSCGSSSSRARGSAAGGTGAGGFWTGAAAGGLLGYMFGNRGNNTGYGGATYRPRPSTSSWGSSGWGSSGSGMGGFGGSSSSGSRSSSGFGGTSRR